MPTSPHHNPSPHHDLPDPDLMSLEVEQPDAARLLLQIKRLQKLGRVLYVAAHPDDENTHLLAYLANERHLQVAYLSLTRGDGGQNLIGSEQGALLGFIRTHELLQARRIDGAIQFFTRARDFGFSKSSKETLRIWDRQAVLGDMVRIIRFFRPDLIITRFPERGNTHGHHLASAILAREAFHAAADPKRFPTQGKPWKTARLLHNVSTWMLRFTKRKIDLSRHLKVDIGGYNPLHGRSYGEIAASSRSMHKSQGFGFAPQRGHHNEYFQHLEGSPAKTDLLDQIDTSWSRIPGGEAMIKPLHEALTAYQPHAPHLAIPPLLEALRILDTLPADPRLLERRHSLRRIIAACAGLFLDARSPSPSVTPQSRHLITLLAINRSPIPIEIEAITFHDGTRLKLDNKPLPFHKLWRRRTPLTIPADAAISAPFWMQERVGQAGIYPVKEPHLRHTPVEIAPLWVRFDLRIYGQALSFSRILRYAKTDPVRGEIYRRTEIAPPFTATPESNVLMFPNGQTQQIAITLQPHQSGQEAELSFLLPKGWRVSPPSLRIQSENSLAPQRYLFTLSPPTHKPTTQPTDKLNNKSSHHPTTKPTDKPRDLFAIPKITVAGRSYNIAEYNLDYPHIPPTTVFRRPHIRLVPYEQTLPQGRFAYIQGAADRIPESLRQIGLPIEVLSENQIAAADLRPYRAILLGIRAFNANPTLRRYIQRFWDYTAQGGTLIVQYNVHIPWRPLRAPVAPLPLKLGRGRVTDENAKISLLDPQHPIFHHPHKITPLDFSGWVQERGLYFSPSWDPAFKPLLRMQDPDEPPQDGSLLIAPYQKGTYIYTGLAFFRQLPAGIPGAYRFLLNLLSHPHTHQKAE
jgi:LmbE family N-acetylglucosaminyl deacetylase